MGRQEKADFDVLKTRIERVESLMVELSTLFPTLRRLEQLLPNLDRLGPRLELIDELGPRLSVVDDLGSLNEPLKNLCAHISVLDNVGEVVDRFLTENHGVSESVRVDVETISALAAQVELFNRQLLEQLHKALES
jgi:hypothetical protein